MKVNAGPQADQLRSKIIFVDFLQRYHALSQPSFRIQKTPTISDRGS
jgi:hypothetical protein